MERFFFEATRIRCFYLKFPPLILSLIKGFYLRQLCGILMVIFQFPSFLLHLFIGILLKGMIFPSIPFICFSNLYEIHPLGYHQYHVIYFIAQIVPCFGYWALFQVGLPSFFNSLRFLKDFSYFSALQNAQ